MTKVLIFIDWFLPAYKAGGPVQSVHNMVSQLSDKIDFSIVTSDRDLNDKHPFEDINPNVWTTYEGITLKYLSPKFQKYRSLKSIINNSNADFIYLNSLFSIRFSLMPLIASLVCGKKIILAPRGMLGKGALKIKSAKKQLFILLFKLFGVHKKIVWQATASSEKEEIEAVFGDKVEIKIAPNLGKKNIKDHVQRAKEPGSVQLFFLSRISNKKNLLAALSYLKEVNEQLNVRFEIIGPIEDETYWSQCQSIIEELPANITVIYKGSFPNNQLQDVLTNAHFLLLPTKNENFGHVIMESWQNSCPVIISDQTPWKDLESKEIGWDIELQNESAFVKIIEKCAKMDGETYKRWSHSSFKFAEGFQNNSDNTEQSFKLFGN